MATPIPKSYEQYYSDMVSTYQSKIGINDYNTGSAVSSFFEAIAQHIYLAQASNFSILRDFNLDRASGEALKKIATEERVFPLPARVSTGRVKVSDSSFTKRVTKIYAGASAPNQGSSVLKVSDASLFPATGSVYVGRGTNNIEGPLAYSSITPVGGFYEINLVSPTTKFHNISESVILAQGGNRLVAAGTAIVAPSSGGAEDINFTITQAVTLLDGENEINNVPVAAQKPGSQGNVPRAAIKRFISEPFTGAVVTNEIQFTTGRDEESDAEIRARVKRARLSKGLGTATAVRNSVLGQQAPDEAATVTSAEIASSGADDTVLYVDNGEGYEEKSTGVGVEFIVDQALGGETNFQLATGGQQSSLAKAFIESNATSPFNITGGDRLAISVGGIVTEHVFKNEDFRAPGFATAYEVVSSVNANPAVNFSGRTSDNAKRVCFFGKVEDMEYIQKKEPTQGGDAGENIGLPSNEVETLRLYKNSRLLSKNGRFATIQTENQSAWANTIATGDTLIVAVDGTQAITYTFTDSDFIDEGTFVSVNKTNTLLSWANVINAKVTGLTATVNGNQLQLRSNLGTNARASIVIDPASTLVFKGMFTTFSGLESQGSEADYRLSRNTAQIKLFKPLEAGDSLTAGTRATKATIQTEAIVGGTVNMSSDAYLWFLVDTAEAEIIKIGVAAETLLNVTKPSANVVRYTSNIGTAFTNVQVGDWVIIWSEELASTNRLEARVNAVTATTLDLKVTAAEYAAAVVEGPIIFQEGFSVLRTPRAVQKIKIPSGNYSLFQIADLIAENLVGVTSDVKDDKYLNITTKTEGTNGSVLIVDFNDPAKVLNFEIGQFSQSDFSLFGYWESESAENEFPLFIHSKISADEQADPPDTLIADFTSDENLDTLGVEENVFVVGVQPFAASADSVIDNEYAQIDLVTANLIDIEDSPILRRMRIADRFYVANTYDFSDNDSLVTILDNDPVNKTFPIPLYRRAVANNTAVISPSSFRAYDVASGPTTQFSEFFGAAYSFKNYKVMMKARNVIHPVTPLVPQDAVLFRSVYMGLSGEKIRISYEYPTQPNKALDSVVQVDELTRIKIFLKSGNPVTNTIDGTTEWDVTITPVGGYDEVTYTWNSNGTAPNIGAALSSGGYATINANGEFSPENIGTFRVVSATANSFTVSRPTGAAVTESNIATLTNDTIKLYELSPTTALEIVNYVTASLTEFIEASLIDDGGTSGSGVITKSTYEDSVFTSESVALVDGQNYILSSNLAAIAPNAQFVFKKPLVMPSYSTATPNAYAFNNGEEIRFIPTTAQQIEEFINTLAVSGISTVGSVKATSKNSKVQIKSEVLGSLGSVQVAGGKANVSTAQVQQSASVIEGTQYTKVIVERSAVSGLHGGQWVKLQANNLQKKDTNFNAAGSINVTVNSPVAGKTSIEFLNRSSGDLFFGRPKNFIRDMGRTFRVEKHGILTALIWDEVGSNPNFAKTVEINDGAGNMDVFYNTNTGFTEYSSTSGTRNFSEVSRNDRVTFGGFLNAENNGTFNVVEVSDDGLTMSVENFQGVDETATATATVVIQAELREGDNVVFGEPFATLNRGLFRIIRRFNNSFWFENPVSVEENVTITANLRALTVDGTSQFDVTVISGGLKIMWDGVGTDPSLSEIQVGDILTLGTDFNAANQGSWMVNGKGTNFVIVENALGVAEANILITDVFEAHIPAMIFSDYEATLANDFFTISGDILGENNIGRYNISQVLSRTQIIVDGLIDSVSGLPLGDKYPQLFVEEQLEYSGYKRIYNKAADPANINQGIVIFDTTAQSAKINKDAGEVFVNAISKLNFPTTIKKGIDSYRYHIGLIRQANKVVYGEPRGGEFEGVAAAGAEIFIQAPLVRRIQISIVVRLLTGVPFVKIIEQVRNNVSSLVNSTGIGKSIAISDVVSAVNAISGVFAVSIASPSYSPTSDVIVVNPAEKPLILDAVADIVVSKVGAE